VANLRPRLAGLAGVRAVQRLVLYVSATYNARVNLAAAVPAVDVQVVGSTTVPTDPNWKLTKHRSIRIEDELWAALGQAAQTVGVDRSTLIRQLVRWYVRDPGAKLPQRPDPTD
jgi:hypothetical protein